MATYTIVERERAEVLAMRAVLLEVLAAREKAVPGTVQKLRYNVARDPHIKSRQDGSLPVRDELLRQHMTAFLDDFDLSQ